MVQSPPHRLFDIGHSWPWQFASLAGLATYDAATGMIDPHPFSLYFVAGVVVPPVASALAAVANMLGWKAK
ncbi:MAG: hypothetical protein U5N55_07935 [Cypionkella sp.]|nr:hypothetical protein [Cypionkella sp.]